MGGSRKHPIDVMHEMANLDVDEKIASWGLEVKEALTQPNAGVYFREENIQSPDGTTRQILEFDKSPVPGCIAFDLALKAGASVFCDEYGVPHIRPPRRPCDTRERQAWPIRSFATEAWVSKLYFEHTYMPLKTSELKDVARLLTGYALDQQTGPSLAEMLDRDIVLALLVRMMDRYSVFEGSATSLLMKLSDDAILLGWSMSDDPLWPKDATRLGARLRQLSGWLKEAGIEHTTSRESHERVHILKMPEACKCSDLPPPPLQETLLRDVAPCIPAEEKSVAGVAPGRHLPADAAATTHDAGTAPARKDTARQHTSGHTGAARRRIANDADDAHDAENGDRNGAEPAHDADDADLRAGRHRPAGAAGRGTSSRPGFAGSRRITNDADDAENGERNGAERSNDADDADLRTDDRHRPTGADDADDAGNTRSDHDRHRPPGSPPETGRRWAARCQ